MDQKVLKKIKIIFGIRIALWVMALIATIYWIIWSFQIYAMEVYDVYSYAALLRPVFGKCLLITAVTLGISLLLRSISDKLKKDNNIR